MENKKQKLVREKFFDLKSIFNGGFGHFCNVVQDVGVYSQKILKYFGEKDFRKISLLFHRTVSQIKNNSQIKNKLSS